MPRAKIFKTSKFPYHITTRTNNREFVNLSMPIFWEVCLNKLEILGSRFEFRIHQFVLMSNHYHLVASTPNENVSEGMEYFNREVAKSSNFITSRENHLFGGRYKPTLITTDRHYWNCLKYVFRNPVRAGICSDVRDYPFSSLNAGLAKVKWEMIDFFNDPNLLVELDMDWLNEPTPSEIEESIRKGLRRSTFKMPRALSGGETLLDVARYKKVDATF